MQVCLVNGDTDRMRWRANWKYGTPQIYNDIEMRDQDWISFLLLDLADMVVRIQWRPTTAQRCYVSDGGTPETRWTSDFSISAAGEGKWSTSLSKWCWVRQSSRYMPWLCRHNRRDSGIQDAGWAQQLDMGNAPNIEYDDRNTVLCFLVLVHLQLPSCTADPGQKRLYLFLPQRGRVSRVSVSVSATLSLYSVL